MKKSFLVLILFFVLGIHSLSANPINKSILEDGSPDPDLVPSPTKRYKVIDVITFTEKDLKWNTYLECIKNSDKLEKLNLYISTTDKSLEDQHRGISLSLRGKKLEWFQMRAQDPRLLFNVLHSPVLAELKNMKSLESYDFSDLPTLPIKAFETMLKLFEETPNLKKLNLANLGLTNKMASSLITSLKEKPFFVALNIADNKIDRHIIPDLKTFCMSCKSLTVLQLHGNQNFVGITDSQTSFIDVNDVICGAFGFYDYLSESRLQVTSKQYADSSRKKVPLSATSKKSEQTQKSNDHLDPSIPQGPFLRQGDFLFESLIAKQNSLYKYPQELYKGYISYLKGSDPFYDKQI